MAQFGLRLFEAVCEHVVRPLLPDVVVVYLILIILNTIFYIHSYHIELSLIWPIFPACQDLFETEVCFPICYMLSSAFWNLIFMFATFLLTKSVER